MVQGVNNIMSNDELEPRTKKYRPKQGAAFCDVCKHYVHNLETHELTEEHERELRSGLSSYMMKPSKKKVHKRKLKYGGVIIKESHGT